MPAQLFAAFVVSPTEGLFAVGGWQMEDGLARAKWYRNRAAVIRVTARRATIDEKLNLTALADSFERLADRIEARELASSPDYAGETQIEETAKED